VADAAEAADVAIDRNVVGRVGEDEIGTLAIHQHGKRFRVTRIAADEPVAIEEPHVTSARHGRCGIGHGRNFILRSGWCVRRTLLRLIEDEVDLGEREAGQFDIELKVDEALHLDRKDFAVPACVQRQLVIGNDVGAALSRVEVRQTTGRDALHAKELGGCDTPVPGDDLVVVADQNRIGEAEALDAVGYLAQLFLGVGARIAGIGPQAGDARRFDGHAVHCEFPLCLEK
jgi:hypothetical protein